MMQLRESMMVELTCCHLPPNTTPQCTVCKNIREHLGSAEHWELLQTNKEYAAKFGRMMQTESRLAKLMLWVPWIELGLSCLFWWFAIRCCVFAQAIADGKPGSYAHLGTMLIDGALAVGSYFAVRFAHKEWGEP